MLVGSISINFSVLVGKLHVSLLFFVQDDGWTALMDAAARGHVNVLKTLIENKADINMLTKVYTCTVHTILYTITTYVTCLIL